MTVNNNREKLLIRAYIIIGIAFLILIKTVQIMHAGRTINWCMYAAIAVNTAMALYYYLRFGRNLRDRHVNLIAFGLFATFVADFFATLIGRRMSMTAYLCGAACFCIVELIYAAYLRGGRGAVIMRAVMVAAGLIVLGAMGALKPDRILGVTNEMLILANVIDAWTARRFTPPMLFRIGITLFFACDTSIIIRSLASGSIRTAAAFSVWVFYIPAQLLITLAYMFSCRKERIPD